MEQELGAFYAGRTPFAEEEVHWAKDGTLSLQVAAYAGACLPPLTYLTSVRGLVFRADAVLTLHTPEETTILPGGRRELGETLEETVRREVQEETGWEVELGPALVRAPGGAAPAAASRAPASP